MIIWGSGGNTMDLGEIEQRSCATCEKPRPFKLFLTYTYSHLYYCRWVTKKQYMLACDVCRRGWELKPDVVESKMLKKSPIPFMTRFGWTIPFALVGLLFVFSWLVQLINWIAK